MTYLPTLAISEYYKEFNEQFLPEDIDKKSLIKNVSFLSPSTIILHGSLISGIRFSPCGEKDVDLIIVSYKKRFWELRGLYDRLYADFSRQYKTKIDVSIISPGELDSILNRDSSLRQSLMRGFTILNCD